MKGQTDWNRVREAQDFEGDDDGPEIDWSKAVMVLPEAKQMVSLRLDADVLEFFRAQGKGYQTRINAVLRAYKTAMERRSD